MQDQMLKKKRSAVRRCRPDASQSKAAVLQGSMLKTSGSYAAQVCYNDVSVSVCDVPQACHSPIYGPCYAEKTRFDALARRDIAAECKPCVATGIYNSHSSPKISPKVPGTERDMRSSASTSEAWLWRGAEGGAARGISGEAVRSFLLPWHCVIAGAGQTKLERANLARLVSKQAVRRVGAFGLTLQLHYAALQSTSKPPKTLHRHGKLINAEVQLC